MTYQVFARKFRPQIQKVVWQIVRAADPTQIILFGSFAYGKPTRDSDLDLLVVMESKKRPVERARDIVRSMKDYPLPMDMLVRTPREIKQRLHMGDPFYQEIIKRGKILYEK
jgi:predicted nucleotidyltransferase